MGSDLLPHNREKTVSLALLSITLFEILLFDFSLSKLEITEELVLVNTLPIDAARLIHDGIETPINSTQNASVK